MKRWLRITGIVLGVLILGTACFFLYMIGPRNVVGMLRYDTRNEGALKVGRAAPDVVLTALDGATPVHLRDKIGGKPLVVVFGSFT